MTRRKILFSLAAGLVALSLGGFEARAGQITLPTSLLTLETAGNFAVVQGLRFSGFSYSTSPLGSPPPASDVTVNSFTGIPGEPGISFNGAFHADAGKTVDYAITYTVTALAGSISDAYLSIGGVVLFGGTGSVSIGETILDIKGNVISKIPFEVFSGGQASDTTFFAPQTTIIVQKDITVNGGSNGATFSFSNQGFSTAIPEPASMALLGIGLSGLFTFRRFFKRASVA
jgi:hypothetical protein